MLLGEPSGGLVDVDLDSPEALALAERLLPPTASRFGRPSKPGVTGSTSRTPCQRRSSSLTQAWTGTRPGAMLVELRATGAQTVFPRASIRAASRSSGRKTASPVASRGRSSGPAWRGSRRRPPWRDTGPGPARATTPLAAGGFLLRCGLDAAVAAEMVGAAARFAGDEEWADRSAAVEAQRRPSGAGTP